MTAALLVLEDPFMFQYSRTIVGPEAKRRLPARYGFGKARDVLHDGDGALADQRDWLSLRANAVARGPGREANLDDVERRA